MVGTANNIFNYGVAINFSGNYSRESKKLTNFFSGFNKGLSEMSKKTKQGLGSALVGLSNFTRMGANGMRNLEGAIFGTVNRLMSLRSLLIGGFLIYGAQRVFGTIMGMGQQMESSFVKLQTVLGGTTQALEALAWAKDKAAKTPFDLPEVNQALTTMSLYGMTKDKKSRDKNFEAIGDLAAIFGLGFDMTAMMMAKAGLGNARQLMMRTGLSVRNLSTSIESFKGTDKARADLEKFAHILRTATKGTKEFKTAWIDFVGTYFKGGMLKLSATVGGRLSNIEDLFSNAMISLIGYTQVQGTFFDQVADRLGDFLTIFERSRGYMLKDSDDNLVSKVWGKNPNKSVEAYAKINELTIVQYSLQDRLFQTAEKASQVIGQLFTAWTSYTGSVDNALTGWITSWDKWFSNFEGKVAPFMVYITLIKFKIVSFLHTLKEGFSTTFGFAWEKIKLVTQAYGWLINKMQEGAGLLSGDVTVKTPNAEKDKNALATGLGALIGIGVASKVARMLGVYKIAGGAGKLASKIPGMGFLGGRGESFGKPLYVLNVNESGGAGTTATATAAATWVATKAKSLLNFGKGLLTKSPVNIKDLLKINPWMLTAGLVMNPTSMGTGDTMENYLGKGHDYSASVRERIRANNMGKQDTKPYGAEKTFITPGQIPEVAKDVSYDTKQKAMMLQSATTFDEYMDGRANSKAPIQIQSVVMNLDKDIDMDKFVKEIQTVVDTNTTRFGD